MRDLNSILVLLCISFLLAVKPAKTETIFRQHTASALLYCVGNKLYDVGSTDAPAIIAASFTDDTKRAIFRTCRDGDGNTHYFVREPQPNPNGVCRVSENEIFPGTVKDVVSTQDLYGGGGSDRHLEMKGWKALPPDDWTLLHYAPQNFALGFVSSEDCPMGDDPRYILLENVTDGMLKAFQTAWAKASRSPATLDKAFRDVPTASNFIGQIDRTPSQTLRDRFREAVFGSHDKISEISCRAGGCEAHFRNQAIEFDFAAGGISFIKLIPLFEA